MFNTKGRGRLLFKCISIIVVLCFFVQDIAWAVNGNSLWSVINGNRVLRANAHDFTNLARIRIPDDYGIIKEIHNTGSPRVIINIQDAHSNLGAQESINKILEVLENEYSLKMVSLEGARGDIDTSLFQSHPDDKARTEIADYFLGRGKINAAEYYKISKDSPVKLYGSEDPSLYRANVDVYIKSLQNKGQVHKAIITLKKAISDLKHRAYSKALKQLDEKKWMYRTDNISFKEYWRYLGRLAHSQRVDIADYPNVKALIEASEVEDRVDFKAAESERQALIELLGKTLSKSDMERLLSESMSFRLGRIESSVFHNHLRDFALSCGIDISLYPNLSLYTDYVNMHSDVIIDELFIELDDLVFGIQDKLFRNDDERLLADISRRADILIDLLDAKIVNRDFAYYNSRKKDFIPQNIAHEMAGLMVKHNVSANLVPEMRVISEALPHVERFYDLAARRDLAMVENTLAEMERDNRSFAALITGGFHTEGISRILREKNISYIVVLPKFSKSALERPYEDIILNRRQPFEDILSKGEYYLQAAGIFSNFQPVSEVRVAFLTFVLLVLSNIQNIQEGQNANINLNGDGFIVSKQDGKITINYSQNPLSESSYDLDTLNAILMNWPGTGSVITRDNFRSLIEKINESESPIFTRDEIAHAIKDYRSISRLQESSLEVHIAAEEVKERQFQRAFKHLQNLRERLQDQSLDDSEKQKLHYLHEREMRKLKELYPSRMAKALEDWEKIERLEQQAFTDPLTGAYNRRYLELELGKLIAEARRGYGTFSYILFDIDHFKKNVNDIYGHDTGDRVLQEIVDVISKEIRTEDILARIGGEEFVVLLPHTNLENASKVAAEKIRTLIQGHEFNYEGRNITISLGVSGYEKNDTPETLYKRADDALYLAKESGRNQVKTERDVFAKLDKTSSAGMQELASRPLAGPVSGFGKWLNDILEQTDRPLSNDELSSIAAELGINPDIALQIYGRALIKAEKAYDFTAKALPDDGKINVFMLRDAFALYAAAKMMGRPSNILYLSKATFKMFTGNLLVSDLIIPTMVKTVKAQMGLTVDEMVPTERFVEFKHLFFELLENLLYYPDKVPGELRAYSVNLKLAADNLLVYFESLGITDQNIVDKGIRFVDTTKTGTFVLFMEGLMRIKLAGMGLSGEEMSAKVEGKVFHSQLSEAMSYSNSLNEARAMESIHYPIDADRFSSLPLNKIPLVIETDTTGEDKREFLFQVLVLRNQLINEIASTPTKTSSAGEQEIRLDQIRTRLEKIGSDIKQAQSRINKEIERLEAQISVLDERLVRQAAREQLIYRLKEKQVLLREKESQHAVLTEKKKVLRSSPEPVENEEIERHDQGVKALEEELKKINTEIESLLAEIARFEHMPIQPKEADEKKTEIEAERPEAEEIINSLMEKYPNLPLNFLAPLLSVDNINDPAYRMYLQDVIGKIALSKSKILVKQIENNPALIIDKIDTIWKLRQRGIDIPFRLSLFHYSAAALEQRASKLHQLYPESPIIPTLLRKYSQIIEQKETQPVEGPAQPAEPVEQPADAEKSEAEPEKSAEQPLAAPQEPVKEPAEEPKAPIKDTEQESEDIVQNLKLTLPLEIDGIEDALKEEVRRLLMEGRSQQDVARKLEVQIRAARKMAEGVMSLIPMGFGKSLTLRLSLFILAKRNGFNLGNNKGVLITTTTDDLAQRDALSAGRVLSGFGLSVGVIMQDGEGRRYWLKYNDTEDKMVTADGPQDITFGTIDRFVHTYEGEELAKDEQDMVLSRRNSRDMEYFLLLDEADVALIEQLMTPFIISGGAAENAEKVKARYSRARQIAKSISGEMSMQQAAEEGLIDISEKDSKRIYLTDKGLDVLRAALSSDAFAGLYDETLIEGESIITWKQLVEQALSIEFTYTQGINYAIEDSKIILIDETSSQKMPGRRLSSGYHAALEAKHEQDGVVIEAEAITINTMMLKTFLDSGLISDFAGASGTMDKDFMFQVHGKSVYEPPIDKEDISKREDIVRMYLTENSKWRGFYADAIRNIHEGLPVLVNVEEGMPERILEGIKEAYRKEYGQSEYEKQFPEGKTQAELNIRIFNADSIMDIGEIEKTAGQPGAITIVTNRGVRGVDVKQDRVIENALDEAAARLAQKGVQSYSTFIHKAKATDTQFRGRIARLPGTHGVWRAYWSCEDRIFSEYKDSPAVATALASLRHEIERAGEPVDAEDSNEPAQIIALIDAVRESIKQSQIKQFKEARSFEDEIEARKKQLRQLRQVVFEGDYNNEQLNDFMPGIEKASRRVPQDKENDFRKGLLAIFDEALSMYLEPVIIARNSLMREMQDAKGKAQMAQADPFPTFRAISDKAYQRAMQYIQDTISSNLPAEAVSEAEKRAPPVRTLKRARDNLADIIKKGVGFLFGGLLIAGGWIALSKVMVLLNVMRLLMAGNTGILSGSLVIESIVGIFAAFPIAVWIGLAAFVIIAGITFYHSYVKLFNQVYSRQAIRSLGVVFRGVFTPKELGRAVIAIPVTLLSMLASAGPVVSIFVLVSALVFPPSAPILIPLAVGIGLAAMLAGAVLIINPWVLKRLKTEKPETPSDTQRGTRSLLLGIGSVAIAVSAFAFIPTLAGVGIALGVLVFINIISRTLLHKFYGQDLEKAHSAKRAKFFGTFASPFVFAGLAGLAMLMAASPIVFSVIASVFSIPLAVMAVLYFIALPYMSSRFGHVESEVLGTGRKAAAFKEIIYQGAVNIRGVAIGLMAGAGIISAFVTLASTLPVWGVVIAGVVFFALSTVSVLSLIKYRNSLKSRIAKGEKITGLQGKIAEYLTDSRKATQVLMASTTLAIAGPSLGAGAALQSVAQSQYALTFNQQLIDNFAKLFGKESIPEVQPAPEVPSTPESVAIVPDEQGRAWWSIDGQIRTAMLGVCYQPVPDGKHINDYHDNYAELLTALLDEKDGGQGHARQLSGMGADYIRLYAIDSTDRADIDRLKAILTQAHQQYGIKVIVGNWAGLYSDPNNQEEIIADIKKMVHEYSQEPWLLAFQIGNENNYFLKDIGYLSTGRPTDTVNMTREQYYQFMNSLAGHVKDIQSQIGISHPVILGSGAGLAEGEAETINSNSSMFDIIGFNIYGGADVNNQHIDSIKAQLDIIQSAINMPLMISEFGMPSLGREQEHADFNKNVLNMFIDNAAGIGGSGRIMAATVFSATDEAWKARDHGVVEEAFFGILGKQAELMFEESSAKIDRINKGLAEGVLLDLFLSQPFSMPDRHLADIALEVKLKYNQTASSDYWRMGEGGYNYANIEGILVQNSQAFAEYQLMTGLYIDAKTDKAIIVTYANIGGKWKIVAFGPRAFADTSRYLYDFNWADDVLEYYIDEDSDKITATIQNDVTGKISYAQFDIIRDPATGRMLYAWMTERQQGMHKNNVLQDPKNALWIPAEGYTAIVTTYDVNTGDPEFTYRLNPDGERGNILYEFDEYVYDKGKLKSYIRREYGPDGKTLISEIKYEIDKYSRIAFQEDLINGEYTLIHYKSSGEEELRVIFSSKESYEAGKHNYYIEIARAFQREQTLHNKIRALDEGIVAIPISIGNYFIGYKHSQNQTGLEYGIFKTLNSLKAEGFMPFTETRAVENFRLDEGWQNIEFFDIRNDGIRLGKAINDTNGEISFAVFNTDGKQIGENTYRFNFNTETEVMITGDLIRYSDSGTPVLIAIKYESGRESDIYGYRTRIFYSQEELTAERQIAGEEGRDIIIVAYAKAFTVYEMQRINDEYIPMLDEDMEAVTWIHIEYDKQKDNEAAMRAGARSSRIQDRRFIVDIQHIAEQLGLKGVDGKLITSIAHMVDDNTLDSAAAADLGQPWQYSTDAQERRYAVLAYNDTTKQSMLFYGENTLEAYTKFYESREYKAGFEMLALLAPGDIVYTDDGFIWQGGFEPQGGGTRRTKVTMFSDSRGNEYPVRTNLTSITGEAVYAYGVLELDVRDENYNTVESLLYYLDENGMPLNQLPHEQSINLRNMTIEMQGEGANARLTARDVPSSDMPDRGLIPFAPVASDSYALKPDGTRGEFLGIHVDYMGRNRLYFEFKGEATQQSDGTWANEAVAYYDTYDEQNRYSGQYAFEAMVRWSEDQDGVRTYAYEIGDVLSWGEDVSDGHYAGHSFVYVVDTTKQDENGAYLISEYALADLGINQRQQYILTSDDFEILGIDVHSKAISRVLRISDVYIAGSTIANVELFDASLPMRDKKFASIWEDNINVRVNYDKPEQTIHGEVLSHIYEMKGINISEKNHIYGFGDLIQLGIKIDPEQIGEMAGIDFDSFALPEGEYFIGIYDIPEGHQVMSQYQDILSADYLSLAVPRDDAKLPQPVIVDSLGRTWLQRSNLGISKYDRYEETVRHFAGTSIDPIYESLDIMRTINSVLEKGLNDIEHIWTISFESTIRLDEIDAINDLFDILPKDSKDKIAKQLNLSSVEDIKGIMLVTATKTTAHGAVFKEYYIAGDTTARRFATEINGSVIFADEWNEYGHVVHSFKVTRGSDIIFEYRTTDDDKTYAELLRDYFRPHGLLKNSKISEALSSLEDIYGFNYDTVFVIVQETPWLVSTDEYGTHAYKRADDGYERPTLLVMLPNDARGRDIIRILPKQTEFNFMERLFSDAKDWNDIIINKWHVDGIERNINLANGDSIQVTNPYGILPGQFVISRKYNAFRIEDRNYIGSIHAVWAGDAEGSTYFEPLYTLDDKGNLINTSGEMIDTDEAERLVSEALQDPSLRVEEAYVHTVEEGDLLITQVLTKEGTLAMSVYKRQLIRIANGVFAELNYLPGVNNFPSGVITKGTEAVYYDLRYPYQRPLFARDEENNEIKRWLDISYEITKDGQQIEAHRVYEQEPLSPDKYFIQVYRYQNGELISKSRANILKDWMNEKAFGVPAWIVTGALFVILAGYPLFSKIFARNIKKLITKRGITFSKGSPPRFPEEAEEGISTIEELEMKINQLPDYGFNPSNSQEYDYVRISKSSTAVPLAAKIKAGERYQVIISEQLMYYRNWYAYVLNPRGNSKDSLDEIMKTAFTIEDLYLFYLIMNYAGGIISHQAPNYICYLFHNARIVRDGQDNANGIKDYIEKETGVWLNYVDRQFGFALPMPAFKKFNIRALITQEHLVGPDDINGLFRSPDFLKEYHFSIDKDGVEKKSGERKELESYVDSLSNISELVEAGKKAELEEILKPNKRYKTFMERTGSFKSLEPINNFFRKIWFSPMVILLSAALLIAILPASIVAPATIGIIAITFLVFRFLLNTITTSKGTITIFRTLFWTLFLPFTIGIAIILLPYIGFALSSGVVLFALLSRFVIEYFYNKDIKYKPVSDDEGFVRYKGSSKENLYLSIFWAVALGIKIVWNYFVFFVWIREPVFALAGAVSIFPGSILMSVGLMWLPFILFFILDLWVFSLLLEAMLGHFYGSWLGVDKIQSWKNLKKHFESSEKEFIDKILPEEIEGGWGEGAERAARQQVAWAKTWNIIIDNLYKEGKLSYTERQSYRYELEGEEKDYYLAGNIVKSPDLKSIAVNKEARERLEQFLSTLFMEMPKAPSWNKHKTLTVLTPIGTEPIWSPYDAYVKTAEGTNKSVLGQLMSLYPDEWINFIDFLERGESCIEKHPLAQKRPTFTPDELMPLRELKAHQAPDLSALSKEKSNWLKSEIRAWCGFRGQEFFRTARGIMYQRDAFENLARICFPQNAHSEKFIEEKVNEKFKYIVGYGNYKISEPETMQMHSILALYKGMYIGYFESKGPKSTTPEEAHHHFVLLKAKRDGANDVILKDEDKITEENKKEVTYEDLLQADSEEVYRLRMRGGSYTGMPKPSMLNAALRVIDTEIAQSIDINQDGYFEEWLKAPNMLQEFDDADVDIVGFPERIFTSSWGWQGWVSAYSDRSFVKPVQRVLALFGVRMHYGHPDYHRVTSDKRKGGVASITAVNEDIFSAYQSNLQGRLQDAEEQTAGGKIIYREYMQAGKAREVVYANTKDLFTKFGMGAAEQLTKREMHSLNKLSVLLQINNKFGFLRAFTHAVLGIGFYIKEWITTHAISSVIFIILFFGLSAYVGFPSAALFGFIGFFMSQTISLVGIYMLTQEPESGVRKGYVRSIVMFPALVFNYMAHVFNNAMGFLKGKEGKAVYLGTGRGPVLHHQLVFRPSYSVPLLIPSDKEGDGKYEKEKLAYEKEKPKDKLPPKPYKPNMSASIFELLGINNLLSKFFVLTVLSITGIILWKSIAIIWIIFFILMPITIVVTPMVLTNRGATPLDVGWGNWQNSYRKDFTLWLLKVREEISRWMFMKHPGDFATLVLVGVGYFIITGVIAISYRLYNSFVPDKEFLKQKLLDETVLETEITQKPHEDEKVYDELIKEKIAYLIRTIDRESSFDDVSSAIADLTTIALNRIDDQRVTEPIMEKLISVVNDPLFDKDSMPLIREQAAYALRIFADSRVISAHMTFMQANPQSVDMLQPAFDQARVNLHIVGEEARFEHNKAIVIESDMLDLSEGAIEAIKQIRLYGEKLPYLIVTNTFINSNNIDAYFTVKGLSRRDFETVFYINDYKDKQALIYAMAEMLKSRDIDIVKLFAVGDTAVAINEWVDVTRDNAITVLALLFNKEASDTLGAGTFIELHGGNIVRQTEERERVEEWVKQQA